MENRDLRNKYKKGAIITLVITVIIIILIFSIFTSVKIEGSSMEPNYNGTNGINDKVIISRIYTLKYGDVIVFKDEQINRNLIKRVVGLEGDTIEIVNGNLKRNGEIVEENYIKEHMDHRYDNLKWEVGKGEVFVMGDNRNYSDDSRMFGPIKKKSIMGEVIIRVNNANGKIYFI